MIFISCLFVVCDFVTYRCVLTCFNCFGCCCCCLCSFLESGWTKMETWSLPNSCRRTRAVTSARLRTSWPPEKRPPFSYRFTVGLSWDLAFVLLPPPPGMTHTSVFIWFVPTFYRFLYWSSIYPHGRRAQQLLCLLHVCHPLRIKGNKRRMGWVTFSVPGGLPYSGGKKM